MQEGGEIFGDDEIWLSNFRFIPQVFGRAVLLPMSKIALPKGSFAQAEEGIAATDQCRNLLVCFAESPEYPSHEDVRFGFAHFSIFGGTGPSRVGGTGPIHHDPLGPWTPWWGGPVGSKTGVVPYPEINIQSTPVSAAHALKGGIFSRFVPSMGSCIQFGLILHPYLIAVPFPPTLASPWRNGFVEIHGGTALFKAKCGTTPQKQPKNEQNLGVGLCYGTNKPPSWKSLVPYAFGFELLILSINLLTVKIIRTLILSDLDETICTK